MKLFNCFIILGFIYSSMISCVSTGKKQEDQLTLKIEEQNKEYNKKIDVNTLNEITTCKHGYIDKVKKNLILIGYEIESSNNKEVVTKYRRYGTSGIREQTYDKIVVTKIGKNLIRFKKIEKYEDPYISEDVSTTGTIQDRWEEQKLQEHELHVYSRPCNELATDYSKPCPPCPQTNGSNVYNKPCNELFTDYSKPCPPCPPCPNNTKGVGTIDSSFKPDSRKTTIRVHEYEPNYYVRNIDSYKKFRDRVCDLKSTKNTKRK